MSKTLLRILEANARLLIKGGLLTLVLWWHASNFDITEGKSIMWFALALLADEAIPRVKGG